MITPDTVFLVVDDAETMRKVNCNQLSLLGARQCLVANNGAEALRILKAKRVNVIVSDWNMPVMDGLALLREVRADPQLAHLPFVMITAESERDQVRQAIAAGVSSIVIKPYTAHDLARHLSRAMQHRPTPRALPLPGASTAGEPASSVHTTAAERPTLLVVDDTIDNLRLIAGLFIKNYRVRVAQDGAKALAICTSNAPPDLILLDIMMPNMDGFEVARRLRAHPEASKIPLIFITSMTDANARQRGLELGAVDFVQKPIDPADLQLKVNNILRHIENHKQLQANYDDMLALTRLREDVEQITRHDFKGPLSGILATVQNLLHTDHLSPRQIEMLQLAETSSLQLLDMINLSGELFKIETGRFTLNAEPVPLAQLLRRAVENTRLTFRVKDLTIELDLGVVSDHLLPPALGDALFCHSIIYNLLRNACEAAPQDSRVRIFVKAADQVRISVENQPAVPPEFRDSFFTKFATFGKKGGSGLGTYSAKMLSEAQNGKLELDIDDERNITRLTLTLPRA